MLSCNQAQVSLSLSHCVSTSGCQPTCRRSSTAATPPSWSTSSGAGAVIQTSGASSATGPPASSGEKDRPSTALLRACLTESCNSVVKNNGLHTIVPYSIVIVIYIKEV